jgi:anti-sigma factor RsiW
MARLTSTGHPADHELLLAIDAAARPARRTGVDRHLNDCAPCRARVDMLRATLQDMTEEYQRVSVRDDPSMAAQRARLAQTLIAMPAPRRSWWRPPFSSAFVALPSWAVAAATVIVIGLAAPWGSWLGQRGGDARPSFARELPAAGLTPGATAPVIVTDLCAGGIPSRVVSADVRLSVLRAYGMEDAPADTYELDALITPELGGTTDARNLWPQRYASLVWHARVKDVLEERLAADVCAGRRDLLSAQRDLATDWIAAYRRYFQTDVPLQAHLEYRPDEPELVIAFVASK